MFYWNKHVSVDQFDSVNDYVKRSEADRQDICLSVPEIIRYSIANASFKGRVGKSLRGVLFYAAPVLAALKPAYDHFGMSGIYEFAESSFKSSISFQIGMLAAHAVFEKILNRDQRGCLLLHGKDSNSVTIDSDSKESPDFVGVDCQGPYVLLEAKGSSKSRVDCNKVDHAKEQLDIKGIEYTFGMNRQYVPSAQLSKHVVTSAFELCAGMQDKALYFSDIDPEGESDTVIYLNMPRAIANYYATVMNALGSDEYVVSSKEFHGHKFKITRIGPYMTVGLMEKLYQPLSDITNSLDDHVRESSIKGLFNLLREYEPRTSEVRSDEAEEQNLSLGPDGLLVEVNDESLLHYLCEYEHF
ncbi:hypothetical protein AAK684_07985 [Leptogranulimonas caecicola]|uniref:Uncharacterized protein n=1 Tax=Leptogranulimonas caecicola TaxID=2894156 RepID=A0AAU9CLN3_9ACTN|nr:hypothetical protein [Leptogranulimonas caecicola]BCV18074.1 hypothetical protein ATOBIA_N03640 [Atopobiaceae bacterium P1]BDC90481.1 hypothetical protein ATTO_03530 [Leptogranulimonas caecicola]